MIRSDSPCSIGTSTDSAYQTDNPLPVGSDVAIAAQLDSVANDATAPAPVRRVAECLRSTIDVPPIIAANLIFLEYICGTQFRIRNTNAESAELRYEVENSDELGDLVVGGRGEIILNTDKAGTVRLFLQDMLIQSRANGGTTCGP